MAKPNTPLWDADEHSLAKHDILREYLEARLPIMAKWNKRVPNEPLVGERVHVGHIQAAGRSTGRHLKGIRKVGVNELLCLLESQQPALS